MLVDPALRRLTGQHLHCVRTFGMQGSVVHEWAAEGNLADMVVYHNKGLQTIWIATAPGRSPVNLFSAPF